MNKGYPAAFASFIIWGLSPIYWKLLSSIPATEIILHRIIWSLPFLFFALLVLKGKAAVFALFKSFFKNKINVISATLLAFNWLVFIWAINNNYILEASLGYFINPIINVLMGMFFLKERLQVLQKIAVVFAVLGVLYLTFNYGQFPWIALFLAFSFATYGLIRKTGHLGSVEGLTFEMLVIYLPTLIVFGIFYFSGNIIFNTVEMPQRLLLIFTGVITASPLLLFAYGARKIKYSTIGIIQYLAPTMQFFIGIFIYEEDFTTDRFIGFLFIWIGLLIYSYDTIVRSKIKNVIRQQRKVD
jgi:chloramphenicol-sensitive protein RarD